VRGLFRRQPQARQRTLVGDLPVGRIAETREVSDVDGGIGTVPDGPLAGRTLRRRSGSAPT
jgi:mannose-6-phosphate isomerase